MSSKIIAGTTSGTALNMSADTSGILEIQTGSTPTTAITVDASQNVTLNNVIPSGSTVPANGMFLPTTNSVGFSTASTERMRIDSSGNLLVGTTDTYGKVTIKATNSNGSTYPFYLENSTPTKLFAIRDDGIIYAGLLTAATGTAVVLNANGFLYTLSSSLRYKKDVEPIDIGLNFILGLNPVKYNLKESDEAQVGFIAEDFPDSRLVSMSRIDKEDETKGLQAESVNYAQIVAPLVKAIQELNAKVDAQALEIQALKGVA